MGGLRSATNWMVRSPVRLFILIFLLGFSLRIFFLSKFPQHYIVPHDRWEDTAIAMSLVERGEFADPYMIPTGPTAHLPPLRKPVPTHEAQTPSTLRPTQGRVLQRVPFHESGRSLARQASFDGLMSSCRVVVH